MSIRKYIPFNDPISRHTIGQNGWQKLNAGNNTLPDWLVNKPIGNTKLGTPYVDSVTFVLDEINKTEEYINSLILLSNNFNISQTYVNGRKGGSIKQMTGDTDWDITFNIKIFAEFRTNTIPDNVEYQSVGNGSNDNFLQKTGQFINAPVETLLGNKQLFDYVGDYLPNDKLSNCISFFNKFINGNKYTNIKVNSIYLNECFGIYKIIPYSIQTQQSIDETNMYSVTIQAYSDNSDDSGVVI